MPEYSLQQRLPSCEVNQKLLADVEAYVLKRWEELNDGKKACKYTFSITDSIGSETLESVNDYKFHKFPDDIQSATLWLLGNPGIRIKFGDGSISSNLAIELDDANARELARGMLSGILDLVKPYETWNYLFDLDRFYGLILSFVLGTLIWVTATALLIRFSFKSGNAVSFGFIIAALLSMPLTVFVHRLRPYTTFETRLNQTRTTIWRFLIAVLGSLVAGVIISFVEPLWKP